MTENGRALNVANIMIEMSMLPSILETLAYKKMENKIQMKHKIGDVVKIKSMTEINKLMDSKNCVNGVQFSVTMNRYCETQMTIDQVDDIQGIYRMKEDPWHIYNDDMIEEQDEIEFTEEDEFWCNFMSEDDKEMDFVEQCVHRIENNGCQIVIPEDYKIVDENGNVIESKIIFIEKKEKYPKTYEECLSIVNNEQRKKTDELIINEFRKLITCRDAYWAIAGKQLGLGKPWRPDWEESNGGYRYVIYNKDNTLKKGNEWLGYNDIFSFPTEKLRDEFFENFKKELELIKELL